MPKISIVIPALNAAETLTETLWSLATQTFRDFEVVLVDDGSTDGTSSLAERFSDKLKIKIIRNSNNLGVAASLNNGISASDSTFVGRLDADDLAHPERLSIQSTFLDQNPTIDVCGSDMPMFRSLAGGFFDIHRQPSADATIKTVLVEHNSISHPSILIRREFFNDVGMYNPKYDYAEDYELWCRGALIGRQYSNISLPLTYYRIHPQQIGQAKRDLQIQKDGQVKEAYLSGILQDHACGNLHQILSPLVQFESQAAAARAIAESSGALLELGRRLPDPSAFAKIVKSALVRHLI